MGESTHGTHQFYNQRFELSKRLIQECGFRAILVEGDWPDSYRVNRYIRGLGDDLDAEEALGSFKRFPTWMWRNADVLELVSWLQDHNLEKAGQEQVGFYGLDLYSMYASIEAVINYLEQVDPAAAKEARERYSCFDIHGGESQRYGRSVALGVSEACRHEAVSQLVQMRQNLSRFTGEWEFRDMEEWLGATENARAVVDAEEYYRTMFSDPTGSWNLRERHMADTADFLLSHLDDYQSPARVIIWAHNSHVGDSRATDMGTRGDYTLGRYMRERHGHQKTTLIGWSTHGGTVTAARDWDMPALNRQVRPALEDSMEEMMHQTGLDRFLLMCGNEHPAYQYLQKPMLQRAIGVVYRPETELQSHYLHAVPGRQFDALVWNDHTRAVEPLEREGEWALGEPAETYPSAL
jgi:erythromycin esterase-like protein